jgi:hypothetical protein
LPVPLTTTRVDSMHCHSECFYCPHILRHLLVVDVSDPEYAESHTESGLQMRREPLLRYPLPMTSASQQSPSIPSAVPPVSTYMLRPSPQTFNQPILLRNFRHRAEIPIPKYESAKVFDLQIRRYFESVEIDSFSPCIATCTRSTEPDKNYCQRSE